VVSLLMRRPDLSGLPAAPPTEVGVEVASEADVPQLAALLDASFEDSWDGDRVRRDLLNDSTVRRTLIIRDGDAIVATASARVLPGEFPGAGYVHWVASDPKRRGQGLGFAATLAVLYDFIDAGLTESVLETDDERLSAIRVYLGLGFVPQYRDESHQSRWSKIFIALAEERLPSRRPGPRRIEPVASAVGDEVSPV
jgi:mycothiol synthase